MWKRFETTNDTITKLKASVEGNLKIIMYFRQKISIFKCFLKNQNFSTEYAKTPIKFIFLGLLQPNPNLRMEKMLLSKFDTGNTLGRPQEESQFQQLSKSMEMCSVTQKTYNEKVLLKFTMDLALSSLLYYSPIFNIPVLPK